jgi:hypothetical protein
LLGRERVICGGEYSPAGRKDGPVCSRRRAQVAYALIPSILGAVRDLAGGLRAVLAVCIGLQLLAAMLEALSSLSSARV